MKGVFANSIFSAQHKTLRAVSCSCRCGGQGSAGVRPERRSGGQTASAAVWRGVRPSPPWFIDAGGRQGGKLHCDVRVAVLTITCCPKHRCEGSRWAQISYSCWPRSHSRGGNMSALRCGRRHLYRDLGRGFAGRTLARLLRPGHMEVGLAQLRTRLHRLGVG